MQTTGDHVLLAGDVGATKTRLALFSRTAGPRAPLAEATFPSARYPSLEALVQVFLSQTDVGADRAVVGVAGPVVAGRATLTNLPWVVDEVRLKEALGLSSARLLNDLDAIANAVPSLEPDDLHTLNAGEAAPGGALAIVAPGTGLGEAFLIWSGDHYRACPSEGGHTDFAPTSLLQAGLLRYLEGRFERVSYERVCSGLGIPNIYAYLKDSGYAEEPDWLAEELAAAADPTPIIATAALQLPEFRSPRDTAGASERACELCGATLRTFVSVLGAEAGNLALKVLSTGGVYLGGGIPRRILPALEQVGFMDAFRRKGRFSDLLARMPVHVILNPKTALLGAACFGLGLPHA
jgi:glucokinase